MAEIVQDLRDGADDEAAKMFCPHLVDAAERAADEIERLRADPDGRARKLVHRFEYESQALHRIQREWLEREIAAELRR